MRVLLQAPDWIANLGIQQTLPLGRAGELVANLNTRYEGDRETNLAYTPATRVGSYEQALRERDHLLRQGSADSRWLGALEEVMATQM